MFILCLYLAGLVLSLLYLTVINTQGLTFGEKLWLAFIWPVTLAVYLWTIRVWEMFSAGGR